MITSLLILIFILTIASTWWFGLWSNAITLINLLLSAMVATSFYENLASFMVSRLQSFAVLLPFISLWLVFAVTFFIMRGITDTLSSMRLRFDFLTETIGRSLLSIAIAWVFVCFAMFSLQLAPLPPNLFFADDEFKAEDFADIAGSSSPAEQLKKLQKMKPGAFGPDSAWVGFIRSRSRGSLSESREKGLFPADERELPALEGNKTLELEARVFDPRELFFVGSAIHRQAISKQKTLRVSTTVKSE